MTYVPSREPIDGPENIRRNADGIARRLSGDPKVIADYKRSFNRLQQNKKLLDNKIKEMVKGFKPVIHAEVNLLDSILTDEYRYGEQARFFGESEYGAKYIGCSKPTCRLCSFYFQAHPSGVQVRSSHGNHYYEWRGPDIYENDGTDRSIIRQRELEDQRRVIMEAMIKSVRTLVAQAVGSQPERRHHDSADSPSNPLRSTEFTNSVRGPDDMASLATGMGRINLASLRDNGDWEDNRRGPLSDVSSSAGWVGTSRTASAANRRARPVIVEVDDDDDGGAQL